MSSHREALEIMQDAVADNTDVYAFVSPDNPSTVTLIANFIPLQEPGGGPYYYRFGDDVLYEIHISNANPGVADVTYDFTFTTEVRNPNTFLYNTGPISSLDSSNWSVRQHYTVTKTVRNGATTVLGSSLLAPPAHVGPRSTPNYASLANAATYALPTGEKVFAGPRAEEFFVDVGAIFDLGTLRPFQNLHLIPSPAAPGVNMLKGYNVHTIALQVPKSHLARGGGNPTNVMDPASVIGVWASASRRKVRVREQPLGDDLDTGPWVQVSRLANPLVNEALIPTGRKDEWNARAPFADSDFSEFVEHPELAKLLPVLYPGVFPHLAALTAPRADLVAILHTGIPAGVIPGFQNYTGSTPADMQRLNLAVPPSTNPNILGILGGDLAGFPNGRRPQDDVVTIELRSIAGATYPLIDKSYVPDAAAMKVTDDAEKPSDVNAPFLSNFPYLGLPLNGVDYQRAQPGS